MTAASSTPRSRRCGWPVADACTREAPCADRADLDSAAKGELGVVALLWRDDGEHASWSLHDDDGHLVCLVTHCPWCGGALGGQP